MLKNRRVKAAVFFLFKRGGGGGGDEQTALIDGKAGEDDLGVRVKCKVAKNKVAAPYKVGEFDMIFGLGISRLGCIMDAADEMDVLTRRGSYYSYGEEKLGQGRAKAMEYLKENQEVYDRIEKDVRRVIAERLAGTYGTPIAEQKVEVAPLGAFAQGASEMFDEEDDEEGSIGLEELGIDAR